jgi:hemerythrin
MSIDRGKELCMALIEWNNTFSVEIKQIDEQHKKLFSLLNTLHDAMQKGNGEKVVNNILKELRDYTSYHFTAEESWMKMLNYPGLVKHAQEHQEAIRQVNKLIIEYARGVKSVPLDVLRFLSNWLQNHILQIDREYAPYLKGKI